MSETKTGTIRAFKYREKTLAITLGEKENDKDIWYSSFEKPDVKKGDSVEFQWQKNDQYFNFHDLKVVEKSQSTTGNFDRVNIDAGNCVRVAADLVIAGKFNIFADALDLSLLAFKKAKKAISNNEFPAPTETKTEEAGINEDSTI